MTNMSQSRSSHDILDSEALGGKNHKAESQIGNRKAERAKDPDNVGAITSALDHPPPL